MNILPEIIKYIAIKLDCKSLINLMLTSKYIYNLLNDNFWQLKCEYDYPTRLNPHLYGKDHYIRLYKQASYWVLNKEKCPITSMIFPDGNPDVDTINPHFKKLLIQDLNTHVKTIMKGDCFTCIWASQDTNLYFWNGSDVIIYKGDNPYSFPEFPPDHFLCKTYYFNNKIDLSHNKWEQFRQNFNPDTQTSYITDRYNTYQIVIYSRHIIKLNGISQKKYKLTWHDHKLYLMLKFKKSDDVEEIHGKHAIRYMITEDWHPYVTSITSNQQLEWISPNEFLIYLES